MIICLVGIVNVVSIIVRFDGVRGSEGLMFFGIGFGSSFGGVNRII